MLCQWPAQFGTYGAEEECRQHRLINNLIHKCTKHFGAEDLGHREADIDSCRGVRGYQGTSVDSSFRARTFNGALETNFLFRLVQQHHQFSRTESLTLLHTRKVGRDSAERLRRRLNDGTED